ncbi:protein croquemort-like [Pararge aegeria]|nr:protein croquemort-like [Pararge aegeria]
MVSAQMKSGLLMGFGSFMVVSGAVAAVFWPSMFFAQLRRMMILSPTSTSFGIWREVPIPMYLECFMFNITNVEDIVAGKNVPVQVEQLGPYVYREFHIKENITWNDNNTVTFYNKRTWVFQPEMSNGSLSDGITSINPIVATIAYILRHQPKAIRVTVNVFMRMFHENMFITANVSSWLFDGIQDPVLDITKRFPDFPINIPFDRFGWFYERNNSREFDGIFLMNTGASDFSQLGNLEKWKYSNMTVFRDECGEVRGSTGELWAPEIGQPEVTIFAPDICTYMVLPDSGPVRVQGIDGVEYAANDSLFDNGHNYPNKECYCDVVRDDDCLPPGALNVSACRYGAPAFVSQPHFYNMHPHYPAKIRGLKPTDDMNFKLSLEMYTGMPLQVSAQLQINLLVRHVGGMAINNQFADPDVLVPMFWFRQEVIMDDHFSRLARFALNLRSGMPYGFYAFTVIGIVLLIAGIAILIRKLLRSPEEPILTNQPDDIQ